MPEHFCFPLSGCGIPDLSGTNYTFEGSGCTSSLKNGETCAVKCTTGWTRVPSDTESPQYTCADGALVPPKLQCVQGVFLFRVHGDDL